MIFHTPVLYQEVLDLLVGNLDGIYIDCTMGEGGHSLGILARLSDKGRLVSFDQDSEMVEKSLKEYPQEKRWIRICDNFRNIKATLTALKIDKVDGVLADLGLSMFHYKASKRGFSFSKDDPLEMSLSGDNEKAKKIINEFSVQELKDLFWQYAQESHAHRIATFIEYYRKNVGYIQTTSQLADIVQKAVQSLPGYKKQRLHPATKVFQALRIVVNDEMESLETLLQASIDILKPKGRGVILSYHSLEDRKVKEFLFSHKNDIRVLRKKPMIASQEEILKNPAARSAKLRSFERTDYGKTENFSL